MAFEFINQILNPILNPLLTLFGGLSPNPMFGALMGVFVIATLVAFFITLANKLLVDQDRLQYVQKEMKEYQQKLMAAQKSGDAKEMAQVQKRQSEFMSLQKEMMTNSFKPMIVTFLPIILIFYWMAQNPLLSPKELYINLPAFVYYVLLVPIFHMFYHQSPGVPVMAIEWLGWYILVSFAMSILFRKFLGLKGGGM
jgi:uncharacterized membrane protein (DUF106 family)